MFLLDAFSGTLLISLAIMFLLDAFSGTLLIPLAMVPGGVKRA